MARTKRPGAPNAGGAAKKQAPASNYHPGGGRGGGGGGERRCCLDCQKLKPKNEFWKKQWKACFHTPNTGRCIPCGIEHNKVLERQKVQVRKAEQERRAAEHAEQQRLAVLQAELREKEKLESYGPQWTNPPTFEIPGWATPWLERETSPFYDYRCPELVFQPSITAPELVGTTYDLIYYYVEDGEQEVIKNRATKGTLEFTVDDEGAVHGTVAVDKCVKGSHYHHQTDVKFTCETVDDDALPEEANVCKFEVSNAGDLAACVEEAEGTIQRIAQRQAIRYMPESLEGHEHQHEYASSIQFGEDVNQAETILKNFLSVEPLLWMEKHLDLPPSILQRVLQFARSKPVPILIIEEGDLRLSFDWNDDPHRRPAFDTNFIARPRRA